MGQHSTRLLVVDDDALARPLLARALSRAGYDVLECSDGREALQLLESEGPMLLVLDYDMPELTGAQVCELVRQHVQPAISTLPIILLTAHSGEQHEVECLGAGADDFVSKPVNTAILKARIETHLRLHTLRAQLQEQNGELERWRRSHELDLEAARLTQQAILPARQPVIVGWETAAYYEPVIQVGGDIYDWHRLDGDRWLFWIADATGHGASAALLTTLTKLVFRHAATVAARPCEVLNTVNAEYFAVFKGRSFLSAACLVIEARSGEVAFAGAGHPPLLISRAGGKAEPIASQAPPIGLRAQLECSVDTARLEPGDTLLLYTDGLYSATDEEGAHFTPDHLGAWLPKEAVSAEDFLNQTINEIHSRGRGEPLPDDLAAIALRRTA